MVMLWIVRATRLLPLVIGAVHAVEALFSDKRGKAKQDAAVSSVRAMLAAVEIGMNKDLLDDEDVERAVRAVIDAYVALQNLVAQKSVAVAPGP